MKYHKYAYYAYTAGVIDSDGCIGIYHNNKHCKTGGSYILRLNVEQSDGRAVDFLIGFWGGKVLYNRHTNLWNWQLYSNKALDVLKKIKPFLRIKQEQAQNAIEFELYRRRAQKYTGKGTGKGNSFTINARTKLTAYHQKHRQLKTNKRPSLYHLQRLSETTSIKEEATV